MQVSIESQTPFYATEIMLTLFLGYLQLYLSKEQTTNAIQAPEESEEYDIYNPEPNSSFAFSIHNKITKQLEEGSFRRSVAGMMIEKEKKKLEAQVAVDDNMVFDQIDEAESAREKDTMYHKSLSDRGIHTSYSKQAGISKSKTGET